MDLSSMRPSSWNGVGAMAKVPAALWVSFMVVLSGLRHSPMCNCTSGMRHLAQTRNPYSRSWLWIPGSLVSLAPRNDGLDFAGQLSDRGLYRCCGIVIALPCFGFGDQRRHGSHRIAFRVEVAAYLRPC